MKHKLRLASTSSMFIFSLFLPSFYYYITATTTTTNAFSYMERPTKSFVLNPRHKWMIPTEEQYRNYQVLVLWNNLKKDVSSEFYDDYEYETYATPNNNNNDRRNKPNLFVNTRVYDTNPEFRNMKYEQQEEEDDEVEYEDITSFLYTTKPKLERKRLNYNPRRTRDKRDTFYLDDDDDDDDVIDVNDEDYEENMEEDDESRLFEKGGGNYWSNPKGGLDTVIPPQNMKRSAPKQGFQERMKNYPYSSKNIGGGTKRYVPTRLFLMLCVPTIPRY